VYNSTAAGCHCQHYGSTGLEPETVCQQSKRMRAHNISGNIGSTELPESFHGSGAVILEVSR